jgi:hypothetical protein
MRLLYLSDTLAINDLYATIHRGILSEQRSAQLLAR